MSKTGAYTAKAVVVSTPTPGEDIPPGWNPKWPFFPGPNPGPSPWPSPPGYEPDYSLNTLVVGNLYYTSAAYVTTYLRDSLTYGTTEPLGAWITWTATIGGSSVGIKFFGDPSYSNSVSSQYSDIGGYWGADKYIQFNVTSDDVDELLYLTATSVVFGEVVSKVSFIRIKDDEEYDGNIHTAQISFSFTYTDEDEENDGGIVNGLMHYDDMEYYVGFKWSDYSYAKEWTIYAVGGFLGMLDGSTSNKTGTGTIAISRTLWGSFVDKTLSLRAYTSSSTALSGSVSSTFTYYVNGEVEAIYSKTIETSDNPYPTTDYPWIEINKGSVTVL